MSKGQSSSFTGWGSTDDQDVLEVLKIVSQKRKINQEPDIHDPGTATEEDDNLDPLAQESSKIQVLSSPAPETDEDDNLDPFAQESSKIQVLSSPAPNLPPSQPRSQPLKAGASSSTQIGDTSKIASEDWGSMNDSEFIRFVNELSQTRNKINVQNSENKPVVGSSLLDNSEQQIDQLNLSKSSAFPEILAQEQSSIISNSDKLILEHSDKYEFNDYAGYFETKRIKQQEKDEEYVNFVNKANAYNNRILDAKANSYPQIFKGCIIHVNGRTDPDISKLHKLIILYGGKFLHHLASKGAVTHIIAEHLTPRKRIQFANCKVVKPTWITQSVEKGNLLDWSEYIVDGLGEFGQSKLNVKGKETMTIVKQPEFGRELEQIDFEDDNLDAKSNGIGIQNDISSQEADLGVTIDAKHKDFLKTFFAKSRLHHLSTWKTNLKSNFLSKTIKILSERAKRKANHCDLDKIIMHVDFDCFFATVSAKYHVPPIDIQNVPCGVTHGGASSDIASCNYVARKFGVSNGMWLSRAQKLCPGLICLKYEFEQYEEASKIFYETLLELDVDSILPVSVDEALVDISRICFEKHYDIESVLSEIKQKLDTKTGCTVSCGAGGNVLLAKLALRKAKPNGIYVMPKNSDDILDVIGNVAVNQLPGVGGRLYDKLKQEMKVAAGESVCLKQVRKLGKELLIKTFGIKTGTMIHEYSFGVDFTDIDILKNPEEFLRKSISIDINWGIRFDDDLQVEDFLRRVANEMVNRLIDAKMLGSSLTLKLALRHPNAPIEPEKFLGMGYCTFVSKSSKLGLYTRELGIISSELKYLWRLLGCDPHELRGVSISMSKLMPEDIVNKEDANQSRLPFKNFKDVLSMQENGPNLTEPTTTFKASSPTKKIKSPDIMLQMKTSPRKRKLENQPLRENLLPHTYLVEEEINWEVFKSLPDDIQNEIKQELKRRSLQSTPKKKRKSCNDRNDIAYLVSPSKKNNYIFNNENLITKDAVLSKVKLFFQGIPIIKISQIKEKLLKWLEFTLDNVDGPEMMDLSLFNDFMFQLLDAKEPLIFLDILRVLEVRVEHREQYPGFKIWKSILLQLRTIFEEQSYSEFEFNF